MPNELMRTDSNISFLPGHLVATGLIALLTSTGCTERVPSKYDFAWSDGWTDSYSSESGTYSRQTINGDTSVTIHLSENDRQLIWLTIERERFLELPAHVSCQAGSARVVPAGRPVITVWYDGDTTSVECDGGCTEKNDMIVRFSRVKAMVDNLLESDSSYRSLPPSGFIFL